MNHFLNSLYRKDTANYTRLSTDALFTDYDTKVKYTNYIDKSIRFVEDFQLLDPVLWQRFVFQFKHDADGADSGWRGEYWGKMMRGAAFTYSYTQDEKLYNILAGTVEDMIAAEGEGGRISSYSVGKEFDGWDLWNRKYVLLGLQYFMEICSDDDLNRRIVTSMCHQVDYIISKIGNSMEGKKPINEASRHWRGLNSSSILEPVVRLYNITNQQKYLDFATYIVNEGGTSIANVFELAYEDKTDPYQYPITKAYELMSCFEGLLEYYRTTGIDKYKQAVLNFGRRLMKTDVTIIGCSGCTHENLDHSTARQTDTFYKGIMQETCVTVTWMKFCYQLLLLSGDSTFADCFEQSLYNALLGAVNTEKVIDKLIPKAFPDSHIEPLPFDSYSPLLPGIRGRGVGGLKIMSDNHYYGCCACIGSAGTGLISKVTTMLTRNGIVFNLYIPGTVVTKTPLGNTAKFTIETAYPIEGKVKFILELDKNEEFNISFRIPAWSKKSSIKVNGIFADVKAGYNEIIRTWSNGDKIELEIDMRTQVIHPISNPRDFIFVNIAWQYNYLVGSVVEETPEAKYHIALRRGPLILARDMRLDGEIDNPVDITYDNEGYVDARFAEKDKAGFDHVIALQIPQNNGSTFTVIDYSSAGKTWNENSKCACWLPTKRF